MLRLMTMRLAVLLMLAPALASCAAITSGDEPPSAGRGQVSDSRDHVQRMPAIEVEEPTFEDAPTYRYYPACENVPESIRVECRGGIARTPIHAPAGDNDLPENDLGQFPPELFGPPPPAAGPVPHPRTK